MPKKILREIVVKFWRRSMIDFAKIASYVTAAIFSDSIAQLYFLANSAKNHCIILTSNMTVF